MAYELSDKKENEGNIRKRIIPTSHSRLRSTTRDSTRLLFLCHINDLPDAVKSSERLFADDCLLYREINSRNDHNKLQKDLEILGKWAENWGMRFNATKCYIMSIKKKTHKCYQLGGHILEQVDSNPYLELQISEDLEWSTHISKITKKANTTIGFLRRNLQHCLKECRKNAYISLVTFVDLF